MRFFHSNTLLLLYYIVFINMMIAGCASVASFNKQTAATQASEFVVWAPDFRSDEIKNSYQIKLTTPKNTISGLFFLKKYGEEWRGTLTNEMGAKAFDCRINGENCELLNIIHRMDKWYIKKTIASDLYFFIHVDNPNTFFYKNLKYFEQTGAHVIYYKKKQIIIGQDGAIRLINKRRNLQYELRKMSELNPDKMLL